MTTSKGPAVVRTFAEVVRASDIVPRPVSWLWPGRLARGKLSLLVGDPGLGKSFLTLDLIARVTSGRAMPLDTGCPYGNHPMKAVLLSAEDDPADTIVPRLTAAGADLDRVGLLLGIKQTGGSAGPSQWGFSLQRDLGHLDDLLGKLAPDCRLVVIDPVSAYLGDDEGHSNTKVRNLLKPLSDIAARHQVAVLAVTHLNKGGNGQSNALYRSMGSLAFVAAARAAHLLARDPDAPNTARRLLVPLKNNLASDRFGVAFELAQHGDNHPQTPGETYLEWDKEPLDQPADVLLDRLSRSGGSGEDGGLGGGRPTPALDDARLFLREMLCEGPLPASLVMERAGAMGISLKTLRNAREGLGVMLNRAGGSNGCWLWSLGVDESEESKLPLRPDGHV